ncbi:phosphotransferase family protein [Cylindrospermum stagnale PCC 7417]|uniref:Phosphotransferase family protein n=1 Tax=Cylindrospermum stagnale PCC 7417 TaxID=56107 RepID=K9WVV5_9NOST|nr:phosphotransferase [Cylindrospermum stagnale]AFZ24510.1 phosphotransferase family protein [Cylindrospermum stagnale PCC 7417]
MRLRLSSNNVLQYLIDAGICKQQDLEFTQIHPKPSNNFIFLTLDLPGGSQLIVKQEYYYQNNEIANRIKRELQVHNFLHSSPYLGFTASLNLEILHIDLKNSILVYNYTNHLTLANHYRKHKSFSISIAKLIGITLATLHHETFTSHNCYDFMNQSIEAKLRYQFPYPRHLLEKPTPTTLVQELPLPGFEFMSLYQRFESLGAAVTDLVANHKHYCLTHNNPRLDNILIPMNLEKLLSQTEKSDENIMRIINWESCSWGDPAFDLGTAIADYLLLWLNSLIVHPAIELNQSLQLATVPLEVIQPSIIALTRSYISSFPKVLESYPDLFNQVIRFTGLALIYEIISSLQSFKSFDNRCVCMLQLAKSLLCKPKNSFESVFGITQLDLLELASFSK